MTCIIISVIIMLISSVVTMRVEFYSLDVIGSTYKSNSELVEFSDRLNATERAMENYVNYHTFDSIDSYYSAKNILEGLLETKQFRPSNDSVLQKEYLVNQFTQSFLFYCGKSIYARRANDFENLKVYYKKTLDCYNLLTFQLSELSNLLLQQNALDYSENLHKVSVLTRLSILIFIQISCIVILLLFYSVTKIINPLGQISDVANRISRRDFNVPLFKSTKQDEIGNICNAFDRMIISIREYIDTIWEKAVTEAELQEKEVEMQALYADAQLRALQNQINPHFLFNTLNTGAQLAMMEGADKTCFFIEQTADFFRYNIQQKNETVSIDEELKLVDNFVYIMSVRFGNRLQFEKDVPNIHFIEQIPVMTLQPLVENCIKHGLDNAIGKVVLHIVEQDNNIVISITDNGKGFPQDVKQQILKAVNSERNNLQEVLVALDANSAVKKDQSNNGTGLINVFMRLKLYYHKDDVFEITKNEEGQGTKFLIRIPKNV